MAALYASEVHPDFMHDYFEMFSRVRRSIEVLCLTSGLRKNYTREVGIRTVPRYQIRPNFLFWGLLRGGRTRKIAHYAKIRYGRGKDIEKKVKTLKFSSNFYQISHNDSKDIIRTHNYGYF